MFKNVKIKSNLIHTKYIYYYKIRVFSKNHPISISYRFQSGIKLTLNMTLYRFWNVAISSIT